MSDFIASNLHKKVDHIMDVFFGAGVASHPTIIEQINYLLFMRALSQKDDDLRTIGITDSEQLVFDGELEKYRWDNLLTLNAEQLFVALEECFRKIPESTTNKTVRLVFRNAHIKLFDKPTLRTVVHEIDAFAKLMDEGEHKGKRDIFGDTYEYLLSKLSQAGTSGQFRTPRHIIEFLVEVVAPKKGETIIDPAVGTAGFLVKAFEYLRRQYTSPEQLSSGGSFDMLNSKEHTFLYEHTFSGFDSDEDMIKFGMMNLYLHGLQNAQMVRQNTLTDTAGSRDKYDVVLANPPFAGKVDRDSVAEELQMNTGSTEVLFLRYMIRHLTNNGRAGVIVPEGVLFNASGAHTKIRELLLENGLWCVVSLPGGVFNPYAGVKTSILFFDKTRKEKSEVLFAKVENDGFSLSAQRKPIANNDLPEIIADIERYKNGEDLQMPNAHVVSYERIKNTNDCNLSGDRYKLVKSIASHDYPIVKLVDICEQLFAGGDAPKNHMSKEETDKYSVPIYSNGIGRNSLYGYTDSARVTKDAVTISARGTIGYTVIRKAPFFPIVRLIVAVPDVSKVMIGYLELVLRGAGITGNGNTIHQLTVPMIKEVKIPLPPLDIQKRIVDEVENKQKAIDHARELISTLERERACFDPSARAQKEGWPVKKFEEIASLEYGSALPKQSRIAGGIPVMGSNGVTGWHNKSLVHGPGIVIGRKGSAGLVNWVDSDFWPIDTTYFVKLKTEVNLAYLCLVLESSQLDKLKGGAGIPGLNRNDVYSSLVIPLPSDDIQKKIADEFITEQKIVDSNKKLIEIYEKKIAQKIAGI